MYPRADQPEKGFSMEIREKRTRRLAAWSVVLLILVAASPTGAHNGAAAVAVPVEGIVVDGDFSDWPDGMRRYLIALVEFGASPGDEDDFQGSFRVGYDPRVGVLYLAVEMVDESVVLDDSPARSWNTEDGCEVYLDLEHQESSVAAQHIVRGRSLQERSADDAATSATVRSTRTASLHRYEWGLSLKGLDLDRLGSGRTVSVDVVLCDKDADGSFSWMAWGKGSAKAGDFARRGDVVLVPDPATLGEIGGQVRWADSQIGAAGKQVRLVSMADSLLWVLRETSSRGSFAAELPAGVYRVEVEFGRGERPMEFVEATSDGIVEVDFSLPPGIGRSVPAGSGVEEKAGGVRRGAWWIVGQADGLRSGNVTAIQQDQEGYIWVGTSAGLSRYDGQYFRHFTTEDGLSATGVSALLEDRAGDLWIAGGNTLIRYDGQGFHQFTAEDGLSVTGISALLEDRRGDLWIASGSGLVRYDGQHFRLFTTEDGLSTNRIFSLAEDGDGDLWVASGALCRYAGGDTFQAISAPELEGEVQVLVAGGAGDLWIGTQSGLVRYDGRRSDAGRRFVRFSAADSLEFPAILTLLEDSRGRLWTAAAESYYLDVSIRGGLSRYDGREWTHFAEELGSELINTIAEDREGNVWVGTGSKLARYDAGEFARFTRENGLAGDGVRAILEDSRGDIWFGTDQGLSRYDGQGFTSYTSEDGLPSNAVSDLLEDRQGDLWIGTDQGLGRYDGQGFASYTSEDGLPGNAVNVLLEDPHGILWIGTNGGGLGRYDGRQFTRYSSEDGLPLNVVFALAKGRDGGLWVGTWISGVSLLDGQVVATFTTEDGLSNNTARVMLTDRRGDLWLGLEQGGLNRYDGSEFAQYTVADGLAHDDVRALFEDSGGILWIGTSGGLSRYDGFAFQNLLHRDGLADDAVSAILEDRRGHVWIGTWNGGVVRYRPGNSPPPIAITNVATNRPHGAVERISLPTSQSFLAFEFRGVSFKTRPESMQYQYRLQGHEAEWQRTGEPRVEYHDLPRGQYTFEVKAIDRDLAYSQATARVEVEVHWPYAQIVLWSLLAGMLVLGGVLVAQIVRRDREIRRARDAAEAASRSKSEFLANMSHEIRTPMNGIVGMVELLLESESDSSRRRYLDTIDISAAALLEILNDILDLSKIEAGRLAIEKIPFVLWDALDGAMKIMAPRAHEKGLELACHVDRDVPEALVGDPVRLRQILLNLIGNAIKFTEAGEVVVRMALREPAGANGIVLHGSVRDTGIGIPAAKQGQIFESFSQADASTTRQFGGTGLGLTICSQLVGLMGGEIGVESRVGEGSTFHFTARLGLPDEPVPRGARLSPDDLEERRVLVVDDNATNRLILEETLAAWKMRVTAADSGPAALELMQQAARDGAPYDLVLLDVMMPQVDGLEVVRRIQRHPLLGGETLLLLSSLDDPDVLGQAQALGVRQYLRKPVTRPELERALLAALARQQPAEMETEALVPEGSTVPELRVLVAEDNPTNQLVAVKMLEQAGHAVTVAVNGVEVLEKLERDEFDLILMDVQMPEMSGLEATRRIRAREQSTGAHLAIIGLTAGAMREDREACLASGMDDFIAKPVRRQTLLAALATLQGLPAAAATAAEADPPRRAEPDEGADDAVVDRAKLEELEKLQGNDDSFLAEMIGLFVTDGERRVTALRQALAVRNGPDLRREAHTLKGSSRELGAVRLLAICQQVEERGKAASFDGVEEMLARVEEEFGRARDELLAYLEREKSG